MDDVEVAAAEPPVEPEPRATRERPRVRIRIFSSASDAPRARRPADAIVIVGSLIGVLLCLVPAPAATQLDTSIATLLQKLPGLFGGVWEVAYDLLFVWPVVLLAATLVARGRKALFRDLLLALVLAFVYSALAATQTGSTLNADMHQILSTSDPGYLAARLAIATALIATASPHMSQPLRSVGRWVLLLGGFATIALALAQPVGTLAGFLIGIAAAATVHLIFGSPGGRLTLEQTAAALAELGVTATDLQDGPLEPGGVAVVVGTGDEGHPLLIKVFGNDARGGRFISSTWSSIRRRGTLPQLGGNWQRVQQEALTSLFAERGGVPVMPVVAAGVAAEGDALLVLDNSGRALDSVEEAGEIGDDSIEGLWQSFLRLGELGVALGVVDPGALFLREDGSVALGRFGEASLAADAGAVQADRAQLLVATALVVGRDRAVEIVAHSIGQTEVEAFLPYLQRAALDPAVWREVKRRGWDLEDLRVQAEQQTGSAPRDLEQLRRVTWGSLLKLGLIGFVAYALISAIANVGIQTIVDEFQEADKAWLLPALLLTPLVQIPQAFSTIGASLRPVRLFPVLMLEYGIQFIALAVPSSAARVALEIRFFERVGVPAAGAVSIGMIDSVSGFTVQMLLILVITISGLASLHLFGGSSSGSGTSGSISWETIAIAFGLLVLAFVAALLVPKTRAFLRRFYDGLRDKAADGREALKVLRDPHKLVKLFVGNFLAQVMLATILGLCLRAFGYSATLAQLILVNTFVSLFAGFMPVPGGVGVAEAGYTAGLIAIGVPQAAATSTAIMFRLITFYLPPIWGSFAMRWMRANRYL